MNPIHLGNRSVGPGFPCFIAAEIGINHNGDMAMAHKTIDAAADMGADAVKFQNFRTEDFLSDASLTYEYESQGKKVVESQFEMFKRYELPREAFLELRDHCARRNVVFFSTPTGIESVQDLVHLGTRLLKNGSDYLVHLPIIRAMARTGLPTVLSTGMATLAEIDQAVRAFRDAEGHELILLHCVSSYPTPPQDVHLRKIPTLAAAFNCLVGFSDHTWGNVAAIGAIAMGACFLEKHFTLDKNLPGPDHRFSADPIEMKALVETVRTAEANLGLSSIGPTPSELTARANYRLSCVASRDLDIGHILREIDIAFRRPSEGLPPAAIDWLVGQRLGRKVGNGKRLEVSDLTGS